MLTKGRFVSPPIRLDLGPRGLNFERADIEISGLEQAGPSFEGRVFLNNPQADLETSATPENGYAGSFHVYGYGLRSPEDTGAESTMSPIVKNVIATDAVRAAASAHDVTVTIVPVFTGGPPHDASHALKGASHALKDASQALKVDGVRINIR